MAKKYVVKYIDYEFNPEEKESEAVIEAENLLDAADKFQDFCNGDSCYITEIMEESTGKVYEDFDDSLIESKQLTEDIDQYKNDLSQAMSTFKASWDNLLKIFSNDEVDCNEFIADAYPFGASFDEIEVDNWADTVINKCKQQSQNNDKVFNN